MGLALVLYVLGAGMAYSLAPLCFPITCKGRSPHRIAGALLWPAPAFMLLVACFQTKFA